MIDRTPKRIELGCGLGSRHRRPEANDMNEAERAAGIAELSHWLK